MGQRPPERLVDSWSAEAQHARVTAARVHRAPLHSGTSRTERAAGGRVHKLRVRYAGTRGETNRRGDGIEALGDELQKHFVMGAGCQKRVRAGPEL